jgi:aquaporin TIP
MTADMVRRGVAEFIGAFALVLVGGGSVLVAGDDLTAVALAHGLVIGVMASAVGHISGGHFNPAVTLGFLVTRRMRPSLAGIYWAAQFAGALIAALALWWIFTREGALASVPHAPAISDGKALVIEAILTFFLVWVIFATAADPGGAFKSISGLAIGFTITFDIFMGGPLTGAAMNPARAFGPELAVNFWGDAWIYYLGPAMGAVAAALAYEHLYLRAGRPAPVGSHETGLEEPRPGDAATS